jgi:TonB family protein
MNLELFHRWTGWLLPRLADHLWQSTLIGLTALLLVSLLHRQSARLRHALLLLGMAKFQVPSAFLVASLDFLGITTAGLLSSTSAAGGSYLHPSLWLQLGEQVPVARMTASVDKWSGVYLALVSTWLLGCFVLTMMWVHRRWRVKALLAGTPRVSVGREADSLRRVSSWMLFKRPVELAMPSGFMEPGVWGTHMPVLLLPQGMTKEMTDAELESVILHELIHVERYDNFIAALQRFLCYLFWFHPLVWVLDRKLLLERERVCDELVLSMNIDSSVYAASIVKVTRFCLDGKLAGASCVTGADLKRRLEMLLKTTILTRFTAWHWTLVGAAGCGLLVFSLAAGYPPPSLLRAQTAPQGAISVREGAMMRERGMIFKSALSEDKQKEIFEKLKEAQEFSINLENKPDSPVTAVYATMRSVVFWEEPGSAPAYAFQVAFQVSNTTSRLIKHVSFSLFFPGQGQLPPNFVVFVARTVEPFGRVEMSFPPANELIGARERPETLTLRMEGVWFEDGTGWGNLPLKAPPADSRAGGAPSRVRVGGGVQNWTLISQVAPVYPPLAKQARIQGEVVLEAVISREGDVTNLRVVSGHPLLVDAALTAARQWKYRPTLLNGQPVEVVSQITVPFKLEPMNP